jgi:hypothetical protein
MARPPIFRRRPVRGQQGRHAAATLVTLAYEDSSGSDLKTFFCQLKKKKRCKYKNKNTTNFYYECKDELSVLDFLLFLFSFEEKYDQKKSSSSDLNGDAVVTL